jgi:endonuclease-3
MDKKKQVEEILRRLKKEYPGTPGTVLRFSTPFELLIATILSAQTTDVLVNKITENLFKKYPTVDAFARADPGQLALDIKPVNFFSNKAKNIVKTAGMIKENFGGKVPTTIAELVTLPGVARKTANIVLSSGYGIIEGIAVDTHVKRLSNRLGLTKQENPVKIEQELMTVTPRPEWANLTYLLIFHGRAVCAASRPRHGDCVLFDVCPSRNI